MKNRLDRQVRGTLDQVTDALVGALQQKGLTVTRPDTPAEDEIRILDVADPQAQQAAAGIDPDAATVGTASVSVRQTGDDVRITLLEPMAKATLSDDADLLEPAQHLQTTITQALDELAADTAEPAHADNDEEPTPSTPGDPEVRRSLLDAIHENVNALDGIDDRHARAETLLVLAKAYTAIVSLERTEEIELHLA